jgi:hypothetical protein
MDIKSERTKIWKLLVRRIRDQYRLVILNEETLEERISFKLSRLNVFVAIGLLSILLVFITTYIIAFTPLKEYIPGYTDITLQRRFMSFSYAPIRWLLLCGPRKNISPVLKKY